MKKILTTILVFVLTFVLVGCGTNNNNAQAMATVQETISKITTGVKKLETISNDDLLIKEFMNTKNVTKGVQTYQQIYRYDNNENSGYNGATFTNANTPMSTYIGKLHSLSNIATSAMSSNNQNDYLKNLILSQSSALKTTCNNISNKNCEISNAQKSAIYDLCNNLLVNLNRINLTKSEIKNEVKSISALKNNYTGNIDQLNSKYTRLVNCFETRISYYHNILSSLNGLQSMLNEIYYPEINNCQNQSCDTQQSTIKSTKTLKPNIDTYENANQTSNKNTNTPAIRQITNQPYINNGNGTTNPYYNNGAWGYRFGGRGYGYNGFGYNGFNGGYPYSPYSNYNPYMPNIDTFGTYSNTDTYKSNKQLNNEVNNSENIKTEEEQEKEETKTVSTTNTNNQNKTKQSKTNKTKRYYTVSEEDYLKYKRNKENTASKVA